MFKTAKCYFGNEAAVFIFEQDVYNSRSNNYVLLHTPVTNTTLFLSIERTNAYAIEIEMHMCMH